MRLFDSPEALPPALAAATLFYLVWLGILIVSMGITWLRNRLRLLPELIPASDWLKAGGFFLLIGIPASAGIALGVLLIQFLGWLGGDNLVLTVSVLVVLAMLGFLGTLKWYRAG